MVVLVLILVVIWGLLSSVAKLEPPKTLDVDMSRVSFFLIVLLILLLVLLLCKVLDFYSLVICHNKKNNFT